MGIEAQDHIKIFQVDSLVEEIIGVAFKGSHLGQEAITHRKATLDIIAHYVVGRITQ